MLFRQLFERDSSTYTYLIADWGGGEALLRAHNPRLQVGSKAEYLALMQGLRLPNPKLMDIAVPANLACGAA